MVWPTIPHGRAARPDGRPRRSSRRSCVRGRSCVSAGILSAGRLDWRPRPCTRSSGAMAARGCGRLGSRRDRPLRAPASRRAGPRRREEARPDHCPRPSRHRRPLPAREGQGRLPLPVRRDRRRQPARLRPPLCRRERRLGARLPWLPASASTLARGSGSSASSATTAPASSGAGPRAAGGEGSRCGRRVPTGRRLTARQSALSACCSSSGPTPTRTGTSANGLQPSSPRSTPTIASDDTAPSAG
jgi:hypothetical protein